MPVLLAINTAGMRNFALAWGVCARRVGYPLFNRSIDIVGRRLLDIFPSEMRERLERMPKVLA